MVLERESRKQLAAYYTPNGVAEVVAKWAVRSTSDTVLEPSFGGCRFLQAVMNALATRGSGEPFDRIYGVDLDEKAFEGEYQDLVAQNGAADNFCCADFLSLTPSELPIQEFDAVVGNPPYISHHNMTESQRQSARNALSGSEFSVPGRASLWAYFVLHALQFLKENGRVAWVLPGSFLYSDYGKDVAEAIGENFFRSAAFHVGERLFREEGTEEISVILLAEGWKQPNPEGNLEIGYVQSFNELDDRISAWDSGDWNGTNVHQSVGYTVLGQPEKECLEAIRKSNSVVKLGDVADIRIGVVTGANWLFIVDEATIEKHGLEEDDWTYILSKGRISSGLCLTNSDLEAALQAGYECALVQATGKISENLKSYFRRVDEDTVAKNVTFGKRADWRQPDDERYPDGFVPYMQQGSPRLILNYCGVNSTNSVHRVYFKEKHSDAFRQKIAVSSVSLFSRVSAEIEGRVYGSGVLKHEIGDLKEWEFLIPDGVDIEAVRDVYKEVDSLLRDGKKAAASERATRFVLNGTSSDVEKTVKLLTRYLERLMKRRRVQ